MVKAPRWEPTNDAPPGARLHYLGVDRDEELLTAAQARLEKMAAPELQAGLQVVLKRIFGGAGHT